MLPEVDRCAPAHLVTRLYLASRGLAESCNCFSPERAALCRVLDEYEQNAPASPAGGMGGGDAT